MTTSRSRDQLAPLQMKEESETEKGLPVIPHRRLRWVSPALERKIEKAWGPKERHQICQVCQEECPSHRSLQLHVNAHFLLHFCPCGFHDVYPYPVIVHKMNCFTGEGHVVDEDTFPEYLNTIRPLIKKALTLAALTSGFKKHIDICPPAVPNGHDSTYFRPVSKDTAVDDKTIVSATRETTPPPAGPSPLATIEERLLRLQADLTQLAPDLMNTTTGLYQLKDYVGRIKRRLRVRQARHRSQTQNHDPF